MCARCLCACGGQKRASVVSLELALLEVVSHQIWALETQLGSSRAVESALGHQPSLQPVTHLFRLRNRLFYRRLVAIALSRLSPYFFRFSASPTVLGLHRARFEPLLEDWAGMMSQHRFKTNMGSVCSSIKLIFFLT